MEEHGRVSVLIVEDEPSIRDALAELFDASGNNVFSAASLSEAQWHLAREDFRLILTDIRLGGKRDGGLRVAAAARLLSPRATIIALTAFPDEENRAAAVRLGVAHFIAKPAPIEHIAALAEAAGVRSAITAVAA